MAVICIAALSGCSKDNKELSGDDIIPFKDPNFLKALLVEKEYEIFLDPGENYFQVSQKVDKNGDGQISVNEAKEVKYLELEEDESGYGITDISEIKYFTSLQYLDCMSNNITNLDLSHNSHLVRLCCNANQIQALNISGLNLLTLLDCGYNSELVSVNVGSCPQLTVFMCAKCDNLESFSVNDCQSLDVLEVDHNANLKLINVAGCPNLDFFYCAGNDLNTIIIDENQKNAKWLNSIIEEYPGIDIQTQSPTL